MTALLRNVVPFRPCLHLFELIDREDRVAVCRSCGNVREIEPEDDLTPTAQRESRDLRREMQDL